MAPRCGGGASRGVLRAARGADGGCSEDLYLHLPVATTTFLACFFVFAASVAYIWQREEKWDWLAHAAAEVAVLFSMVVLLTGMIWARKAWGMWWTWSPRLTFSLVLWLLYLAYLVVRPTIESAERRAMVCAVYGIIAFLDVPLVYFSTKLMLDMHPSSVDLAPAMQVTMSFWFAPVLMLCAGLIRVRYLIARAGLEAVDADASASRRAVGTSGGGA
ncbi:MAG: cytochrome c biogenesis protein CcsA [Phycisphaerales bacterium]|nr:cytochrome c biogenesis protein CcsA [Phycisphaerales bacterium]